MTYHPNPIQSNTLFSSWVFYWTILYLTVRELSPSTDVKWMDPTFAILFTLTYQFYALINIIFRVNPFSKLARVLVKFTILTTLFKLGPLYFVWDHVVNWSNSILSCVALFSIYLLYISNKGIQLMTIYNDLSNSYIADDNRIEFYKFLQKI
jgi:hypothetical protein